MLLKKIATLTALIAAAALLIFVLWSSPSFQECGYRQNETKSQIIRENPPKFTLALLNRTAVYVRCAGLIMYEFRDAVTALATIFIAMFTLTLWLATDKLWRSGQATFEASQRAFVFLDGFDFELKVADDRIADADLPAWYRGHKHLFMTYFALRPRWKNAGETQTRKMFVQVDWRGPPGPIPPVYDYRKPPEPLFLAPKAVEGTAFFEAPTARVLVENGLSPMGVQPCVFIWGRADYEDVFGKPHFIEWCHQLRLEAHDGKLRAGTFQWGDYNRSD
jgi:hypothetical protein